MKLRKHDITLLLLLLFSANLQTYAQYGKFHRPKLQVLEDKNGAYDIHKILSPEIQKKFVTSETEMPSFSFTKSVIWCKFSINTDTSDDLYIDLYPKILNTVILYSLYENGEIDSVTKGTLHKPTNEEDNEVLLFSVPKNAKEYYLKVKTNTRLFIDVRLKTAEELISQKADRTVKGIYGGILLMIFLYNLFLLLTAHDKIYFYYLLHLISALMNFLYLSGLGNEFVWRNFPWVSHYFISIMSFGFIFSVLFTIKFLDTEYHSKSLHKGMLSVIAALAIIGFIDLVGFHILAVQLLNILGFLIIIYLIIVSIIIQRTGYKPASTFLTAWIFYFTGISIQVLQGLSILPTNIFTANSILIGSVFELTLLSLSIGYKINFLKEQMKKATISERAALEEKEKLIQEESIKLEQLAEEQSKQIQEKNKKLKKQFEEIKAKNELVKQQNEILHQANKEFEEKNKIIEQQHQQLVYHKNNLETIIAERTKELEDAVKKAKEADEIKTAFLRDVSHEIRTPMNAISGFASLLFNIDPQDHRHKYYVDIIYKNTENLIDLIENIIELSKLQTGTLELKYVKFFPNKIFSGLYDLFVEKIKEQNKFFVSLKVSIPENDQLVVKMDYNRLWKVLYHLLDNAVKYTDTGFVDFGYTENKNGQFEVFVKDSGKGIPKDDLDTIFDHFRKTDKEINRLYSGTGLGLSLVKGLVSIMNGTITVNSLTAQEAQNQNHGTTFILRFNNVLIK